MKIKLFIDFDGTVFNTEGFRQSMFEIFQKSGFAEDEIERTYKAECLDYKYSPFEQMDRLLKIHDYNIEMAKIRFDRLFEKTPDFIFEDVTNCLKTINRNDYEIVLFTLGDINFQKRKVESSKIGKYFDDIYYTDIQKWIALEKMVASNERFVIIDDRSDTMTEIAKKFRHSLCMQMLRASRDYDDPVLNQRNNFSGIQVRSMKQALHYL